MECSVGELVGITHKKLKELNKKLVDIEIIDASTKDVDKVTPELEEVIDRKVKDFMIMHYEDEVTLVILI